MLYMIETTEKTSNDTLVDLLIWSRDNLDVGLLRRGDGGDDILIPIDYDAEVGKYFGDPEFLVNKHLFFSTSETDVSSIREIWPPDVVAVKAYDPSYFSEPPAIDPESPLVMSREDYLARESGSNPEPGFGY